jgi:hypothetical protein
LVIIATIETFEYVKVLNCLSTILRCTIVSKRLSLIAVTE